MGPEVRSLLVALSLAVVPAAAAADPNPQLLRTVETRLAYYDLHPDMRSLTTAQAGALHMAMMDDEDGYFRTRAKLKAILRWNDTEDE